MTVNVRVLVPSKFAEAAQVTQYTAPNVTAIIDKFTGTNVSSSAVSLTVNIFTSSEVAGVGNTIVKTKTLQPSETYTFPEITGQVLSSGSKLSTIAGTSSAIVIRVSGREIT